MTISTTPRSAMAAGILVTVCAFAPGQVTAAGLDCGKPPEHHAQADAALAKVITSDRVDDGASPALQATVKRLRGDGLSSGLIVDHAVAAYCPLVARDDGLSLDQKREAVRRFASELTTAVYDPYDPQQAETAVVLSLPVKPALSRDIDAAAAKAGTTRDAWILQAVRDKLDGR